MARSKKMPVLTFRQLVDRVARDGITGDARPVPVAVLARDCGVSRPHFYNAIRGDRGISHLTVVQIAMGLQKHAAWVDVEIVKAAIAKSRRASILNG